MVNSMVAEELMRRGLHINCLPEEILIKIFSNLAARDIIRSVLPVCRLWYKLGYDPVLWKSLEFSYRSEHSCPNMIRTVTQRYDELNALESFIQQLILLRINHRKIVQTSHLPHPSSLVMAEGAFKVSGSAFTQ